MKEIIAIIRPQQTRATATKEALDKAGVVAYSSRRVLGRSRQGGLRYGRRWFKRSADIQFLPKRMFEIVVENHQLSAVVAAITEANQTGAIGDGKIFVLPVEEVIE